MNSDCDDPLSIHSDTVSSEIEAVSDDILDNNDVVDSDIFDNNDVVDNVEEDPVKQQLLSRLSEEHQQDEVSSVSTRINFGIQEYKEPETHITIENCMRRVLNLGNEKEKKKRRKPAKPTIDKGYVGMENTRRVVPKEPNNRFNKSNKKSGKTDAIDGLRKPFRDINLENEKVPEINPTESGNKLNSSLTPDSTNCSFSLKSLPQNKLSKSTSSGSGLNLNSLAQQHCNTSSQGPDNRPGLNLNSLSLSGSKSGSGLNLGSLAQNHLSSNTSSSGLCLTSLATQHLTTSSSGLSLTSLATQHLSEQPSNKISSSQSNSRLSAPTGLIGLDSGSSTSGQRNGLSASTGLSGLDCGLSASTGLSGLDSGSSTSGQRTGLSTSTGLSGLGLNSGLTTSTSGLSGLAQLHLQDRGATTAKRSGFTIPSLFGSPPPSSTPPSASTSTRAPPSASTITPLKLSTPPPRMKTPEADIDLSSALRSASPFNQEKSPEPITALPSTEKTRILVEDFCVSQCSIRKRKSSPLGAVVVRKWSRLGSEATVLVVPPRQVLEGFKFDEPSPDEAILVAQSKAFNRPSLASRVVSRPKVAV